MRIFIGIISLFLGSVVMAQSVDSNLPLYEPTSGVSGTIKSVGSDTMNNTMTLWAEGFLRMYPNVQVEIEGKGSSTAPPALTEGTATFGPMSREMKASEIDEFEAAHGYKPTNLIVAIDTLAVYVHKDNPIQFLTLQQLDSMFSSTRKRGGGDIINWGQLGLEGDWAERPISLYGRNSASGTYGYFKKVALKNGDYKNSVKEQPGSSAVIQGVANETSGIGYSGIGYKTDDVRVVPIVNDIDGNPYMPNAENAYSGRYPLARPLYLYVNYRPNSTLPTLQREFLRYVLSRQGQQDVTKDGHFPVSARLAEEQLKKVSAD